MKLCIGGFAWVVLSIGLVGCGESFTSSTGGAGGSTGSTSGGTTSSGATSSGTAGGGTSTSTGTGQGGQGGGGTTSTSSGSGGSTSSSGSTSTSSGSTSTSSGSTSSSSGGGCSPACDLGLECCDGACVNIANDIKNCGACGVSCGGDHPFCNGASCQPAPCLSPDVCPGGSFCCGQSCCPDGQLCCDVQGPGPSIGPTCQVPVNGTCPIGCLACN